MKPAIELHLIDLSLSNTVPLLDIFRIDRCRSTVHTRVQKADLELQDGHDPAKIALDETVVKVDGERFWLVAAVDQILPASSMWDAIPSERLVRRSCPAGIAGEACTRRRRVFRRQCPWLQTGLFELGCTVSTKLMVIELLSNASFRK